MRILASILLCIGTILGALGGARLPDIHLPLVAVALGLLVVGAVLYRLAERKARQAVASSGTGTGVEELVAGLPARLDALVREAPSLSLEELAQRLEIIERECVAPVGEAVPRFLATLGGEAFSHVFGAWASGERQLHRAWSAAADGHRPEALASLQAGTTQMREALARLEAASAPEPPPSAEIQPT